MIEHRWFVAGPHRVHARVAVPDTARGPRSTAILVHGIGVSSRYFVPTLNVLGNRRPTCAVDLPGFGRSPGPERALNIRELADSLHHWVEAAGIVAPVLIANSFGCQVVADLAARNDLPCALVLVGPTVDADARNWVEQALRWLRDGRYEPTSLLGVLVRDYVDCGLRRPLATFSSALDDAIEDKLADVEAPVLIVRGEHDPIAPDAWCRRLLDAAPRGQLRTVHGAGHTVNYSHPTDLSDLIDRFIATDVR